LKKIQNIQNDISLLKKEKEKREKKIGLIQCSGSRSFIIYFKTSEILCQENKIYKILHIKKQLHNFPTATPIS